jgi:hypothetical protein
MRSHIDRRIAEDAHQDNSAADRRLPFYKYERRARVERAQIIGELLAEGLVWCIRLPRRLFSGARKVVAIRRGEEPAANPAAE